VCDPGHRLREHRETLIGYLNKMPPWEPAYLAGFAQVLWIDEQLAKLRQSYPNSLSL
jgi:hypothetical protein